ncbi:hypothetical protein [Phormidium sp. CCY1219]|uniref:hypothetical protein n=1 Tax=Phormidium sp. CCY1219 TaxID=2886104 RepID=UPI002D1F3F65|nr:hypothetical protein [Phormidium sp. CCY1219]MEB3828400.1 hypothetical protein [Phormidium sp. CCY1219]
MRIKKWWIIPPGLALLGSLAAPGWSQPKVVTLSTDMQSDPLVLQGTSGGSLSSDCGYISEQPSQTLELTEQFSYLRFQVESEGEPTLLIDGPGGRFCILGHKEAGEVPEMSGLWMPGTYNIYVGDRQHEAHPYRLSITERPN